MENPILGKLKNVDLRDGWKNEATNFTNWLAEEENLELISDVIGIDIELIQTEANVGAFSVDILAKEKDTENKIIVENQLENTDHDHLGKIITYASGVDAKTIIWIVKDAREEHRQAVDWLNNNTNEGLDFYLLKIELLQIENSSLAPRLAMIANPNEWTKTTKRLSQNPKLNDLQVKQLKFWNAFKKYATENKTTLHIKHTNPSRAINALTGNSDYRIWLIIDKNTMTCEFCIPNNKGLFLVLLEQKEAIEKDIGVSMKWSELPNYKVSRITISSKTDFQKENKWEEYFEWMQTTGEKFQKVFAKYII